MDPEELRERTKCFTHRCVKLALALPNTPLGNLVQGQLLRCSTSVPSNYRAACLAQSKAHFVAKMSIVAEEADESDFWLKFIIDEALLEKPRVAALLKEANELTKIFISGRKTAKNRSVEFRAGTRSGHNNQ
ncbi:MAG: four helix bundle protein [Planctomycetes bacterium]|nr:four helix bundle protein [Planctomycetota bacterium]